MEGCERKARARGICTLHYQRWRKYGDPEFTHFDRLGDNVGYAAVHTRLRNWRGLANQHTCIICGRVAMDWSYEGCDDEKIGRAGKYLVRYCIHIEDHYRPRCRKCHVALRRRVEYTP